ncbi:MAG: ABC transporter permease [Gemmatimonadetes bacterium]|nr:ABC transporter permease [Gemmatimonadota bacterium]
MYRVVCALIRLSARLVPGSRRAEWRREWQAELAHAWLEPTRRKRVLWRALLSIGDAVAVRRAFRSGGATQPPGTNGAPAPGRVGMDSFGQDLRTSFRALVRRPVFTIAAVLTIALGIGTNAGVFGVVNALLLQPLPYAQPERLVAVWPDQFVANREVAFVREASTRLDEIAALSPGWLMALTNIEQPEQVNASRVTGNLFSMLGVRPLHGRSFGMDVERPESGRAVMLGYPLWQRVFGGDIDLVGRSITLNGQPHTVVAVMPPGFEILRTNADLWMPLAMDREEFTWQVGTGHLIGRLAAGSSVAAANAEFRELAERMRGEFDHPDDWATAARVTPLKDALVGDVRQVLLLLLGAVALLLLIAVANVANLLLVRAAERREELAVRLAMGARPRRIVRLFLAESGWIGLAGGMIGVMLGFLGVGIVRALLPADTPRLAEIGIDGTVLAACAAVTLLSALVFGVAPGLLALRDVSGTWLRRGRGVASSGGRARGALVALEVALALALVAGATLMARTMIELQRVDPGFAESHLLTMRLQPRNNTAEFWQSVMERIRSTPGVEGAGTVLHLPMSGRSWTAAYRIEGHAPLAPGASPPTAAWQSVSRGYFEAAGIPLLSGRTFTAGDREGGPRVVVINEAFADDAFPNQDPIGQRIDAGNATRNEWATVVGVVGTVLHDGLSVAGGAEMYVPWQQTSVGANSLIVRTSGDPLALAPEVRRRILEVDPTVPISQVRPMEDLVSSTIERPRAILVLLATFAGIGLALGLIGIYGVVAYGVRQQVREIGIRVALGAQQRRVVGMVVRRGLTWSLLGVAVGLPAAWSLAGLMRGLVFGITPTDPLTFVAIPVLLVTVAALAAWLPARRVARIDPASVLRD